MNHLKRSALYLGLVSASALATTLVSIAADADTSQRDAELLAAKNDAAIVKQGKKVYRDLCLSCHGNEKVTGDAVTNLFDMKWYHGGRPSEIELNTLNGFLDKGMPAWKDALPAESTTAVVAYLLSFQKN